MPSAWPGRSRRRGGAHGRDEEGVGARGGGPELRLLVKFLGWILQVKQEVAAAAPPPLTKDQEPLAEIRDLLKGERPEGG
jgi:hypothetical protein